MRVFVVDVRSEVHRDCTRALYVRKCNKDRSVDFVSRVWKRFEMENLEAGKKKKKKKGAHFVAHKKKFNLSRV